MIVAAFPPNWEVLEQQLHADVEASIATLITTVDTLNTVTARTNTEINTNPAASIKDVAREVKTVARQLTRLSRMCAAVFDSPNIGAP